MSPLVEASAQCSLHESQRRIGERRDRARDLERRRPERGEARMEQLVEIGGDRKLLAGSKRSTASLQRGGKLQREERVATRCLPESDQRRTRELHVEPCAKQLVGRAQAQADDVDRS